jgi:hypothetical protein
MHQAALASLRSVAGADERRRASAAAGSGRRRYYAKDIRPEAAGSIDWSNPAADIAALVRGLNFGPYPNPLTTAKAWLGGVPLAVRRIEVLESMAVPPGGSVLAMGPEGLTVSTETNDVVLSELATLLGSPRSARDLEETYGLKKGGSFQSLGADRSRARRWLRASASTRISGWAASPTSNRSKSPSSEGVQKRSSGAPSDEARGNPVILPISFRNSAW